MTPFSNVWCKLVAICPYTFKETFSSYTPNQEKNQNAEIPADYRQFEILKAHKELLAQHQAEIIRLQDKVYQLNRLLSMRR